MALFHCLLGLRLQSVIAPNKVNAVGNKPNQLVRGGEELLKYLFIECKHQQSSGL